MFIHKEVITMYDNEIEVCSTTILNDDLIKQTKENMPNEEILKKISEFFKILGESTRIKIITILFQNEMCVCDIAAVMNMSQPAISQQLRVLKSANLVKYRKEGKSVFYSLSDDHVKQIFDQGMLHITE